MRRSLILSLVPALVMVAGCGDDGGNSFPPSTTQTQTDGSDTESDTETGAPADLPEPGDGDGDPTGDGDGDPTGDGDGDPTGDGDGDPPGMCGNGIVDPGEQCDGDDLNGFTCVELGYETGELACDPVTCTYDASGCMIGMDTGGGTTG